MGLLPNHTIKQKPVTKENIFERVTSLQIFEYYLQKQLTLPITILSPFRQEDRASFCIYGKNAYSVHYEDKTTQQKGDCISLVMNLYSLSFYEALIQISIDFKLNLSYDKFKYSLEPKNKSIPKQKDVKCERKIIEIKSHKDDNNNSTFIKSGIDYWQRYGITKSMLNKHNVYSAEFVFINTQIMMKYTDANPIFAYLYNYNNSQYYKIYRPLTIDKSQKFFNDFYGISKYLIHGVKLLPSHGETLIITKSAKDCMVMDTLGFNSVAVQSEGIHIMPHHMKWFQERWKNIILLYDNDWDKKENWGQLHAQKMLNEYIYLKNICIPDNLQCTDISDTIYKYGAKYTKQLINNLLKCIQ